MKVSVKLEIFFGSYSSTNSFRNKLQIMLVDPVFLIDPVTFTGLHF